MTRRGGLLLALLLAVGLLWWQVQQQRARQVAPPGPPPDDHYVEDFVIEVFDRDGRLEQVDRGRRLVQPAGRRDLFITAPDLQLRVPGARPWRVTAERAWLDADLTEARLSGHVLLRQAGDPVTRVCMPSLALDIPARLAHTADPVQIDQGASRIAAVGLRADLPAARLQLQHDVEAHYAP